MKPGDLVRLNIDWSSQYHGMKPGDLVRVRNHTTSYELGIVVGLGSHETANVMVSGIGMRTFDWDVLEVVNEAG